MKNIRKCGVCECDIKIKKERLNTNSAGDNNFIYTSDDGVYFEEGKAWFCFSCWNEMTKDIFGKFKGEKDE
jgi:hypothetical protein